MTNSFRSIDLGIVTYCRPYNTLRMPDVEAPGMGYSIPQSLDLLTRDIRVEGYLRDPTQAQFEAVQTLGDGQPGYFKLDGARFSGFGVIREFGWEFKDSDPLSHYYAAKISQVPCIGALEVMGTYGRFTDRNYMTLKRKLDPFSSYQNVTITSAGLTTQQEFYSINIDTASARTLEFCIWCGNDISKFELWAWKAADWAVVDSWGTGGAKAWGALGDGFTDDNAVAHTFRVNHDTRGVTPTNFTNPVPLSIGNNRRVVVRVDMAAYVAANADYDYYGGFQLLLRTKLTHINRDTLRVYPIVTYDTGGVEEGPA